MIKFLKKLFNCILPYRCLCCGTIVHENDALCVDCFDKINFITSPYCQHCGTPLDLSNYNDNNLFCTSCLNKKQKIFRLCRAAVQYDEYSKKLILDFKFSDHVENRKLLSKWMYRAGHDIFSLGVDVIIPVPLHYSRILKRKYNQSAILALELSKLSNIPVDYNSLKKIKYTLPQVQCNSKQRHKNVKNAFKVMQSDHIKGKRVLLIDDVYTTGATMKECALALKNAGAKSIDVLTVAKVCG